MSVAGHLCMFMGMKLCCEVWFEEFVRFFYLAVNNTGLYVSVGDNMLTAVSVARDCGIIPLGQRVVVAHGLSGHSGEPAQLLYTNANNNHMPSPLTTVSIYIADIFLVMFSYYIHSLTQKN